MLRAVLFFEHLFVMYYMTAITYYPRQDEGEEFHPYVSFSVGRESYSQAFVDSFYMRNLLGWLRLGWLEIH